MPTLVTRIPSFLAQFPPIENPLCYVMVIQRMKFQFSTAKIRQSKSKRGGPQKAIKSSANNSVIFKPKIQVRGVFRSEK